jgi:hypothetical protein
VNIHSITIINSITAALQIVYTISNWKKYRVEVWEEENGKWEAATARQCSELSHLIFLISEGDRNERKDYSSISTFRNATINFRPYFYGNYLVGVLHSWCFEFCLGDWVGFG